MNLSLQVEQHWALFLISPVQSFLCKPEKKKQNLKLKKISINNVTIAYFNDMYSQRVKAQTGFFFMYAKVKFTGPYVHIYILYVL